MHPYITMMRAMLEHRRRIIEHSLERARALSEEDIARELAPYEWRCMRCGRCCSARFGDNTVQLSREEAEAISRHMGMPLHELIEPSPLCIGSLKLGWVLRRDKDGQCVLLEGGLCSAYPVRPMLCATYPFWLREEGNGFELECGECEGLGMGWATSPLELAGALKRRLVCELEEERCMLCHILTSNVHEGVVDSRGIWQP